MAQIETERLVSNIDHRSPQCACVGILSSTDAIGMVVQIEISFSRSCKVLERIFKADISSSTC